VESGGGEGRGGEKRRQVVREAGGWGVIRDMPGGGGGRGRGSKSRREGGECGSRVGRWKEVMGGKNTVGSVLGWGRMRGGGERGDEGWAKRMFGLGPRALRGWGKRGRAGKRWWKREMKVGVVQSWWGGKG